MITISCEDMGNPCKATVSGESMDDVLRAIQQHAIEGHGYTVEQANAPEKLDLWRGAVRQTTRPSETRTIRFEL